MNGAKEKHVRIILKSYPEAIQRNVFIFGFFCFSVRSPQWLRSKWWALKKHVPESDATSFEGIYSYLYHTYIATLQNKIERQEARFKGNNLPRVSVIPGGRPVHINPMTTGAISNSGISHTITGTLILLSMYTCTYFC